MKIITTIPFIIGILFLPFSIVASENCDTVKLKSGKILLVESIEFFGDQLKIETCDDSHEAYLIKKENILEISYNKIDTSPVKAVKKSKEDSLFIDLVLKDDKLKKLILKEIKDSSIIVQSRNFKFNKELKVSAIQNIKFTKKGKFMNAVIIGSLVGASTGFIIGSKLKNEFQKVEQERPDYANIGISKSVRKHFTLTGLLSGALVGTIVGTIKINISINGNQKKYEKAKEQLKLLY